MYTVLNKYNLDSIVQLTQQYLRTKSKYCHVYVFTVKYCVVLNILVFVLKMFLCVYNVSNCTMRLFVCLFLQCIFLACVTSPFVDAVVCGGATTREACIRSCLLCSLPRTLPILLLSAHEVSTISFGMTSSSMATSLPSLSFKWCCIMLI